MAETAADHRDGAVARRRIRNRALAIALSVVPFGLSFGAVSVAAGLTLLQTCMLSLVLFSGASQFALVSIVAAGGGLGSALATALLLGTRNGLYATRVAELVRLRGWRRAVAAQVTIDESTAMAVAKPSTATRRAPSGQRRRWSMRSGISPRWPARSPVAVSARCPPPASTPPVPPRSSR